MYTQETGRGPLKNKKFEELTNGTPLRQEKSRYERAKEIANTRSMEDGGERFYSGDFGNSGGRRVSGGRNRDIGSYMYNFAKEMISPSKPKPSAEQTKGSGYGGRGY